MVPGGAFPFAKHFGAERHQAMEALQEVRKATSNIRQHEVFVRTHEGDGVNKHPKLTGAHSQSVKVELPNGRVRTKEVVTQ